MQTWASGKVPSLVPPKVTASPSNGDQPRRTILEEIVAWCSCLYFYPRLGSQFVYAMTKLDAGV